MSVVAPPAALKAPTIPNTDYTGVYTNGATKQQPESLSRVDTTGALTGSGAKGTDGAPNMVRVEQDDRSCASKTFGPWGLLFKSIIPDFKGVKPWQWVFLALFCAVLIVFSFIDVNYWLYPGTVPSWKSWENLVGLPFYAVFFWWCSSIASFTGSLCVFQGARGKYSNFFWGLINVVLYSGLAFSLGMAGDAQLNAFVYFPLNIFGLYSWYNSMFDDQSNNESFTAQSKSLKLWHWAVIVALATGIAAFLYWEIAWFSIALTGEYIFLDQPVPRALDAVSTSLSIFAQVLLMLQFWENWALWIIINVIAIIRYSGIGGTGLNVNLLLMWSFYLVNACYGLYDWYTRYKKELSDNPVLATSPPTLIKPHDAYV